MSPKEIELLSELTIIIPTYNRPLELERAIEYWRDTPVTVHILDGSVKPCFRVGRLDENSKVFYHHIPIQINQGYLKNWSHRMQFSLNLPNTAFTALCADDDFFTLTGMVSAVTCLKNDKSIDAIVGRTATYRKNGSKVDWQLRYADWRNSYEARSNDVSVRLLNRFDAPTLFYGIVRTHLWQHLTEICFRYPLATAETLVAVVSRALCRIHLIEEVLWVRQAHIPWQFLPEEMLNPPSALSQLFDLERFEVRRKMCEQIERAIKTSSPEFDKNEAHRLAKKLTKPRLISRSKKVTKFRRRIIKNFVSIFAYVPLATRTKINRMIPYRFIHPLGFRNLTSEQILATQVNNLAQFAKSLHFAGIEFNHFELKNFEKLLVAPREGRRLRTII